VLSAGGRGVLGHYGESLHGALVSIYPNLQLDLKHYNGSHIKALMAVYPEVGLQEVLFENFSGNEWVEPKQRREFFDKMANERKFDPLEVDNWYYIKSKDIHQTEGGWGILRYYKGSHIEALVNLYPELHFSRDQFHPNAHFF